MFFSYHSSNNGARIPFVVGANFNIGNARKYFFFLPHFLSLSSLLRSLDIDSRGSSYNRENIVIRLTNDWL